MATEANCQRSVITSFLINLFVALMLIILYLYYHQLNNCRYDSNFKKILTLTIILILMILTLIQMTP
jgi:hypothetical protein